MQGGARLGEERADAAGDPHLVRRVWRAEDEAGDAVTREQVQHARPVDGRALQQHAQLLVEEGRQDVAGVGLGADEGAEVDVEAGVPGERHLGQGGEQPAVRPVVVGEDESG